jgi:hypothetical protein
VCCPTFAFGPMGPSRRSLERKLSGATSLVSWFAPSAQDLAFCLVCAILEEGQVTLASTSASPPLADQRIVCKSSNITSTVVSVFLALLTDINRRE